MSMSLFCEPRALETAKNRQKVVNITRDRLSFTSGCLGGEVNQIFSLIYSLFINSNIIYDLLCKTLVNCVRRVCKISVLEDAWG